MPDLSNSVAPRTSRSITVAGLLISVTLAAYLIFQSEEPAILEPEEAQSDGGDVLRTVLVQSKLEWDLTLHGKPIPTDMKGLRTVPSGFLHEMWGVLLGNSDPTPTTSSGSPSSSEGSRASDSTSDTPPPSGSTGVTSPPE